MTDDEDLPEVEPMSYREWVIHEVETLVGTDWPDSLAQRLNYANAESLRGAMKKWKRHDLARQLERSAYDGLVQPAHAAVRATKREEAA